jgi:hypothetical protein
MALSSAQIQGLIKTHQNASQDDRAEWAQHGRWYRSEFYENTESVVPTGLMEGGYSELYDGGRSEVTMETNYPYAFIDTMVANVCPTSPNVTVIAKRDEFQQAAKYREALINDTLRRNKAHEKLWKLATETGIYRRSFLKVVWNDRRSMPIFRVIDPKYIWFDLSAEDWDDIRYVIEVTVLTKEDFEKRVKRQRKGGFYDAAVAKEAVFNSYPQWLRDTEQGGPMYSDAVKDVFQWVTIYEVYDFTTDNGTFYHFLDNVEEPLMKAELPYAYMRNPFHMLVFNDNLIDIGGLSDVKLIAPVQKRLNELDTLELWHTQTSIPTVTVNTGAVDNAEDILSALQDVEMGSIIKVAAKNKMSLKDVIGNTPSPQLSPSFDVMRNRAQGIIEFVLGIPQYSRGQIGSADVATEVALADAATRTRNGRRQKRINDALSWMAEAIVSLYDELLPENSRIPLRLVGTKKFVEVTRQSMALRDLRSDSGDEAFAFDIEAIPTNALENNKLVQIKNILETWPILQQGIAQGQVDPAKLMDKLVTLLAMPDILTDTVTAPPGMPQPGMPPGPPGMPPQPGIAPTDTLAGGALPAGTEPASVLGTGAAGGAGDGRSLLGSAISNAKQTEGVVTGPFTVPGS